MNRTPDGDPREEINALRDRLNSNYPKERKAAARRVIALMRAGEPVLPLFSDMLRLVKTPDLELKKHVYLFLVTFSAQEPEQAIMAVSAFDQDSQSDNPLVRALAVRTMTRIKIPSVAEHMLIPLKKCLRDSDAYVRKTAALGVAKLFSVIPDATENAGLLNDLADLFKDENPLVVANAAAAAAEVGSKMEVPGENLLAALAVSSDWCQAMLLDSLSKVKFRDDEIDAVLDRLTPLLKHPNASVVVGAFRCILQLTEATKPSNLDSSLEEGTQATPAESRWIKAIPPFVTLAAGSEPEVQFIALRTLSLFVQRHPKALAREIRVFFCKYNDPPFVKMEKVDIVVRLTSAPTAALVLDELAEYCNAVDVAFVRRAVKAVGEVACRVPAASTRAVDILAGLVGGRAEYALEEAVIVLASLFRKFPGKFEGVVSSVCEALPSLRSAEARAAGAWVLGEYCSIIENSGILLDPMIDNFRDEAVAVQLQILTAAVKIYLSEGESSREQLQYVLNEATRESVSLDVRGRGFVYWRLLSQGDDAIAEGVVRFERPQVSGTPEYKTYDDKVLGELLQNAGRVAGVLHVVESDFVSRSRTVQEDEEDETEEDWIEVARDNKVLVQMVWDNERIKVRIGNLSDTQIGNLAVAMNLNPIGATFAAPPLLPDTIGVGESAVIEIPLSFSESKKGGNSPEVDIAIRTSVGNLFGRVMMSASKFTREGGRVSQESYKEQWGSSTNEETAVLTGVSLADDSELRERNVFVIGRKENRTYLSLMLPPSEIVVVEAVEEGPRLTFTIKAQDAGVSKFIAACSQQLFAAI